MADDETRAGFVARGFDEKTLLSTAVTEPATTVRHDVATILASPAVSPAIRFRVHLRRADRLLTLAEAAGQRGRGSGTA